MSKAKWLFYARLAVAVAVLAFLVVRLEPTRLLRLLSEVRAGPLLASVLLILPNLWIQTAKWRFLLRLAHPRVSWATAWRSFIVGYPLAFVTPGRLGEVGRAWFVPEMSQMKVLRLFAFDKLTNLAVILSAGGMALAQLRPELQAPVLGLAGLIAGLGLALVGAPPFRRGVRTFLRLSRLSLGQSAAVLGYAAAFFAVFVAQFVLLLQAFAELDLAPATRAAAATFFVKSLLPISFADLGIREGAAVYLGKQVGLDPAAAFNAALSLFLVNVVLPTLLGLPVLIGKGNRFKPTRSQ